MSVFTRASLEASPLADLHTIASELGMDGYRRLRKADLVGEILKSSGSPDEGPAPAEPEEAAEERDERPERPARTRTRGGRGSRGGVRNGDEPRAKAEPQEDRVAEGTVEVLQNGSGFLRVNPPDASDDDIYISGAQVRRCELVSGDTITGPVRPPRRSERFASLVRIDTINGKPADEVAEGTPFDELPAEFPTERFALGSEDLTLKAVEWLTPFGRGSRVTITGAPRAGKSELLRSLVGALASVEGIELSVALVGVRPEELNLLPEGIEPVAKLSFGAGQDSQSHAVDRALDTAKRIAARGGDAVVAIDTLDGVSASTMGKAMAAARNITGGGSLTVIATAKEPIGGESTVIALDVALTSTGRLPAIDLLASGTLRPELLVGEAGAEAIAKARSDAA